MNNRIKNKLVFRIRVIEKSGKEPVAIVALKGNAVLVDGIAHVEEVSHYFFYLTLAHGRSNPTIVQLKLIEKK
jgi:hypothetical protein